LFMSPFVYPTQRDLYAISFQSFFGPGMVYQDLAHRIGGNGKKMVSIHYAQFLI